MKTKLDYYDGVDKLPEDSFRISPSSFYTFITKPHQWYREQVLKEEGFKGNTASVIGTCVHYVAECIGKGVEVDKQEIENYINNFKDNVDVDIEIVKKEYPLTAETLVNGYVLANIPTIVEEFIQYDLGSNIIVAGSVDALDGGTCIVDYKTYSSKTKPKNIPIYYKYQLLIYAYIYTRLGKDIDRIRLVYVNRPIDGRYISEKTGNQCGKIHPPEVTVLTESITKEDLDFIESVLTLCKDTYIESILQPEITHLLYKDMRLKKEI